MAVVDVGAAVVAGSLDGAAQALDFFAKFLGVPLLLLKHNYNDCIEDLELCYRHLVAFCSKTPRHTLKPPALEILYTCIFFEISKILV